MIRATYSPPCPPFGRIELIAVRREFNALPENTPNIFSPRRFSNRSYRLRKKTDYFVFQFWHAFEPSRTLNIIIEARRVPTIVQFSCSFQRGLMQENQLWNSWRRVNRNHTPSV